MHAVAIVGMAGRFPGASTVNKFWDNICAGMECITFFDDDQLRSVGVAEASLKNEGYVRARAVLDDIDMFDAPFFGYSPRDAEVMDPQMRIFLECAWEALEQAGHCSERYRGEIGVFASCGFNSYLLSNIMQSNSLRAVTDQFQVCIGNEKDYLATRVSYHLNLTGPSVVVQTACSSSLVAIHMACQSLLGGECDMALAGGVSISTPQVAGYQYVEGSILSSDGHCRAFDAKASGGIRGSGVGIVVLKCVEEALSDGDEIHAIIRGSAVNNDGSSKVGYMAPSVRGQTKAITEALAISQVDASAIGFVEAHGTGTSLGDPVEIKALSDAFGRYTEQKQYCAIGSVKTNIGHLDVAAGVAGLIKAVLATKHGVIPPTLHFECPNPEIDFKKTPFYVNREREQWNVPNGTRLAGVSSFGLGGTNAHAIIEEFRLPRPISSTRSWHLILLSCKTKAALETATDRLAHSLGDDCDYSLEDVAYTLQVGRTSFEYRRAVVSSSRKQALQSLSERDPEFILNGHTTDAKRVAFLISGFSDINARFINDLYHIEPTFRNSFDSCCAYFKKYMGIELRDVVLKEFPKQTAAAIDPHQTFREIAMSAYDPGELLIPEARETIVYQPLLFAVGYALCRLWMSWNIRPCAILGYSLGEYVAACIAGVMDTEDAVYAVAERAKLISQLPDGGMTAISLSLDDIESSIEVPIEIASEIGPHLSIVAGPLDKVRQFERACVGREVVTKRLRAQHAFHTEMMKPIAEKFATTARKICLNPPKIPYLSNVTGNWISDSEATDPRYWVNHLCEPVRFRQGVAELFKSPKTILLEIGAGQDLSTAILQNPERDENQIVLATLPHALESKSSARGIQETLGKLWLAGADVEWPALYTNEKRRRCPLPSYPFERESFWIESAEQEDRFNPEVKIDKTAHNTDEWLYVPTWKRTINRCVHKQEFDIDGSWVIFSDEGNLASQLDETLKCMQQDVIKVVVDRNRVDNRMDSLSVNPDVPSDYTLVVRELWTKESTPRHIVHHIDSAETSEKPDAGFQSVLFLLQALANTNISTSIKLWVITSNMQSVNYDERISPGKSLLLGLCRVIPQEFANITCQMIDIPSSDQEGQNSGVIEDLVREFASTKHDTEVAYRVGARLTKQYEKMRVSAPKQSILRENGVYLITGGLGNIGFTLARWLAKDLKARLILTGRTVLPNRAEWHKIVGQRRGDEFVRLKIERIVELEKLGGQCMVAPINVSDEDGMRRVIKTAVERFGSLNGVIHCAGTVSREGFQGISEVKADDLERHFEAKVYGVAVLDSVLRGMNLDFRILISSISTILGGLGMAVYAAANAFMDGFVKAQNVSGPIIWRSVNWDKASAAETVQTFKKVIETTDVDQIVVSSTDLYERIAKWATPHSIGYNETELSVSRHRRPTLATPYVAPRTELEKSIEGMLESLLGVQGIGIHDSFFEMGGHSLMATQIIAWVANKYEIHFPLGAFFETPTIEGIAMSVEELVIDNVLRDEETNRKLEL